MEIHELQLLNDLFHRLNELSILSWISFGFPPLFVNHRGWPVQFNSQASFIFAAAFVCQAMFSVESGPPQASGLT
jgi:hypothetical protein